MFMREMAREWHYRGLVIARREADDGVQGRRLPTQPRHAFHVLANVSPDLLASNLAGRFHSDAVRNGRMSAGRRSSIKGLKDATTIKTAK